MRDNDIHMNDPAVDPELLFEAHEWRLRNDIGDLDATERSAFAAWLARSEAHCAAYDRAITLGAALATLDPERLRPAPAQTIYFFDRPQPGRQAFSWWSKWVVGAAAALILVALIPIFLPQLDTSATGQSTIRTYLTEGGSTRSISLSDGSKVLLDAGSELRVTYGFKARDVRLLSGAALFDVMPDPQRPFTVSAGALHARAVGTVFDVRFNAGISRVAVAEGRVRVSYPLIVDAKPLQSDVTRMLGAGQQIAALEGGLGRIKPITAEKVGAWQEGRVDYVAAPPAELVADLSRYSGIDISINDPADALREKTVSGSFDMHNVDSLLEVLGSILPVSIERQSDKKITLKAE
ncbi:MAG: FecR domain-containing protein [Pseudomonadota bacterium]